MDGIGTNPLPGGHPGGPGSATGPPTSKGSMASPPPVDPTEQSTVNIISGKVQHPPPKPPPPPKTTAETTAAEDAELEQLAKALQSFTWSNDAVATCAQQIMDPSSPEEVKLNGVLQLKQLLCTSREKVFGIAQDVIESGVLRALVTLVDRDEAMLHLRLAAAFCLTNIAAGSDEQTLEVVKAGGIDPCIKLLTLPDHALRRQGIFCLANVAGATPEIRKALAARPQYFSAIQYAVKHASEPKIEELAAWNIRNMCVLGGPSLSEVSGGLEFFAEQIHRSVPLVNQCRAMIVNGQASMQAVMNGTVDMGWVSGRSFRSFHYTLDFGHGTAALRFACETFSHVSRSAEGRIEILHNELVVPILFLAKFSTNHSVRNHSLECLVNLANYGPVPVRQTLEKGGAIVGLSELLADGITYTPHQRILAARTLTSLVNEGYMTQANATVDPLIITREVARMILKRRLEAEAALRAEEERLAAGRAAAMAVAAGRIDDLDFEPQNDDTIEEPTDSEADERDSFFDHEDDNHPGGTGGLLDSTAAGAAEVRASSTLEIAHSIFAQAEGIEEYTLREKCGRLIIAILTKASEGVLYKFLNDDFFRLIFDILEIAVDVDTRQCMIGLPSELAGDKYAEERAAAAASTAARPIGEGGASAITALIAGEPELPQASFVVACLNLLERLFTLGDHIRSRDGSLDNPIVLLLQQQGAIGRLEAILTGSGGLPFDVIQKTILLVQKYCR